MAKQLVMPAKLVQMELKTAESAEPAAMPLTIAEAVPA